MKVYFKFLNDWILLDNDVDNICGDIPTHFVEFIDQLVPQDGFVQITHNYKRYYLHYSNIQWTD